MRAIKTFLPIHMTKDGAGRSVFYTDDAPAPADGAQLTFVMWPSDLSPHTYRGRKVELNWTLPTGMAFFKDDPRHQQQPAQVPAAWSRRRGRKRT